MEVGWSGCKGELRKRRMGERKGSEGENGEVKGGCKKGGVEYKSRSMKRPNQEEMAEGKKAAK